MQNQSSHTHGKHEYYISILYSFVINLDQEDVLNDNFISSNDNEHVSDDEYETIDMGYNLPNMLLM